MQYPPLSPLTPGTLAFNTDGAAYSPLYDDVYHSADGALGQARHVFLGGNGLPQRWRDAETFTIVETGFGLGLNFLATWQAWQDDPQRVARLHFVSVEKHPFAATDLADAHRRWPEVAALSAELIAAWPPLIGGFHRLHLAAGRVTLTLLFGDAANVLSQLEARAEALYLDGFAPEKNADMWSPAVMRELARLSAPGATLSTYTVAGSVRRLLNDAGFSVSKARGFGGKREMLIGHYVGHGGKRAERDGYGGGQPRHASQPRATASQYRHALIIGAGLAGTFCAERLAARGWQIDVIDQHAAPAQEASGNPAGILHPVLHASETATTRLARAAFVYASQHLRRIEHRPGALHLATSDDGAARVERLFAHGGYPENFVRQVDAGEAAELAHNRVGGGGYWLPQGLTLSPAELCHANLTGGRIRVHFGRQARLVRTADGWRAVGSTGAVIAAAPLAIAAAAHRSPELVSPHVEGGPVVPLVRVRGQLSYLPPLARRNLAIAITGDGFAVPLSTGGYCLGATFQHDDDDAAPRIADHEENLLRLHRLLPGFAPDVDARSLDGRVAWRAATPDRLPVFGATAANLYMATGLGSRGLLWAPLGAELIAAQITGEPWPVERELAEAVHPGRFALQED